MSRLRSVSCESEAMVLEGPVNALGEATKRSRVFGLSSLVVWVVPKVSKVVVTQGPFCVTTRGR